MQTGPGCLEAPRVGEGGVQAVEGLSLLSLFLSSLLGPIGQVYVVWGRGVRENWPP